MAMTSGSVTIANDGTVSGAGAARTMFDAYTATQSTLLGTLTTAQKVGVYRSMADLINSVALMIDYIKTNGKAHVAVGGLQLLPTPATAGTLTVAPSTPVDVPLV
jgi:hypothetical protein